MLHDIRKRGVQDGTRINVLDYFEFHEWAAKFKINPEDLKIAFNAVGPKINNLREYLHEHHFIVAS